MNENGCSKIFAAHHRPKPLVFALWCRALLDLSTEQRRLSTLPLRFGGVRSWGRGSGMCCSSIDVINTAQKGIKARSAVTPSQKLTGCHSLFEVSSRSSLNYKPAWETSCIIQDCCSSVFLQQPGRDKQTKLWTLFFTKLTLDIWDDELLQEASRVLIAKLH